jgi:hypothetical protein
VAQIFHHRKWRRFYDIAPTELIGVDLDGDQLPAHDRLFSPQVRLGF